jgi:sugar transferase (PEP-CTERM/EpsH1 system associated)
MAGVRSLVHGEHGLDMIELDGHNLKYNTVRRLSRLVVDHYLTVSQDLADWLVRDIGVDRPRLTTIYNGVDTQRFSPGPGAGVLPDGFVPPGGFVVGTIGRMETVKDQSTLAAAFCHMIEARPELRQRLRLVIVGDGSLRRSVLDQLAKQNAVKLAWLPGFRSDAPALLRAFDVFVLPSRREGISNTLLEAMATAKPVVATAVGGNSEIVVDSVTGQLVQPSDPAALAERLLAYIDDPRRLELEGRAGLARVHERFSLEVMIERYQAIYDDLVSTRDERT